MKHINLIPLEARKISRQGWIKKYILKSPVYRNVVSILLLLLFIFAYEVSASARYKFKITLAKKEIRKLERELERNKEIQNEIAKQREKIADANKHLQKRISFLEKAKTEAVKWSEALFVLNKLTPSDLWLKKISLNKDMIILSGTTLDNATVSDFMLKIDGCGYFKTTDFNFTRKNKDEKDGSLIDFEIATHLARN